jgi:hypothetical protein
MATAVPRGWLARPEQDHLPATQHVYAQLRELEVGWVIEDDQFALLDDETLYLAVATPSLPEAHQLSRPPMKVNNHQRAHY